MKTYRNLYPLIYAFDNLYRAYIDARRGKRYQAEVLKFTVDLEDNLLSLYQELQEETYTTGEYHYFTVYEPKKREVAALPFRDRVVHHAIHNILEPIFDRGFIYHSYACREGKGTHAGADQVTHWLREIHRKHGRVYVFKADIKSYFASIDHAVLIDILKRKIRCQRTMALLRDIIYSAGNNGKGIPIGNLTSQLFANVYLNELDQYVKHQLRLHYYLRYMDDFIVLHHTKKSLRHWRYQVETYLADRLKIQLNNRTVIFQEKRGVDFLGYRIWRTHRLLRKCSVKRMKRRLGKFEKEYAEGGTSFKEINASVQSWIGHAMHADTYNLRRKLFSNFRLRRNKNGD